MVPVRRVLHDQDMGRHRDRKLQTIGDSTLGRRCSSRELVDRGRAGDLVDCEAGATVHSELDARRWAYLLLEGDVALSQHGDPLAVAARGSWFPLHDAARADAMTLTALSDSQLLVFRRPEIGAVLDLPGLVAR